MLPKAVHFLSVNGRRSHSDVTLLGHKLLDFSLADAQVALGPVRHLLNHIVVELKLLNQNLFFVVVLLAQVGVFVQQAVFLLHLLLVLVLKEHF